MSSSFDFNGKLVVITGGSSGIGKAIVKNLLNHNAIVANADVVELEDVTLMDKRYFFFKTDVTNVEEVQQLYTNVRKAGTPNILICNAGIGIHEKLVEGDPEKWFKVINTNLMGTLRILRSFLPDLLSTKNPHIIFISSVAANNVYEYGGIYAATKAAINVVAETLRIELKEKAKVTVISPGVVDTAFFDNMESGSLTVESIGLGSLHPAEIADAVLYVLSTPSGQVINNITIRPIKQTL